MRLRWGVRSRADLAAALAFVVGMLLGAVLLVLLLSLVGRSGQVGDVGLPWATTSADPRPHRPDPDRHHRCWLLARRLGWLPSVRPAVWGRACIDLAIDNRKGTRNV